MTYKNDIIKLFRTQWVFFVIGISSILILTFILNIFKSPLMAQPGFIFGALTAISVVIVVAWISDSEGRKFDFDGAKKKIEKSLDNSATTPA